MSQFYVGVSSGSLPPTVLQQFTADDSTIAVPAAGNINNFSNDSTTNNNNGIQTTNTGSTITTLLTNRLQGTGSTVGASTTTLVTFPLGATPGAYNVEAKFIGFEPTTPASTGYTVLGTIRTTGAAGAIDGIPDETPIEHVALITSDVNFVISGNNLLLQVVGVAGLNISWNVVATYSFIS
jgi:hypothetical protein